MAEMITVVGIGDKDKVVLWEKNKDHPDNGEAFVVCDGYAYEVAKTTAVKRALAEGRITTEIGNAQLKGRNVNWNSSSPALRPATEAEEDAAGLKGSVEKQTAMVEERPMSGIRRGNRP